MRWRTTAVYLAILLLVGGYFYYFEVLKTEQRQAEEKEARRVFSFSPEAVSQIEIGACGQIVQLEKQGGWRIVQPLASEVDRVSFDALFSGLKNLETMRSLGPAPENLGTYGLAQPALKVRFQVDGQWRELLVGSENPTGDARYAKKGESGEVFLIDRPAWQSLNKTLKDLRKKELFTWRTDQVQAMDIEWRSGEKIRFERRAEGKGWTEAGRPDLKIKADKVEKLLDQVQWLRAADFLDESAKPDTPAVKLAIQLKGGAGSGLALGEPDQASRQAVALTQGFPVPVKVASHIFREIPKSADAFQDRSLLTLEAAEVRGLKWKRVGAEGSAARTDQGKWESGGKPLDDPWPVKALIEDAAQVEYIEKADNAPELPGADSNRVEFLGPDGQSASISWSALPEQDKGQALVQLEQGGKTLYVRVQHEDLRRLDESLADLAGEAPGKKPR